MIELSPGFCSLGGCAQFDLVGGGVEVRDTKTDRLVIARTLGEFAVWTDAVRRGEQDFKQFLGGDYPDFTDPEMAAPSIYVVEGILTPDALVDQGSITAFSRILQNQ